MRIDVFVENRTPVRLVALHRNVSGGSRRCPDGEELPGEAKKGLREEDRMGLDAGGSAEDLRAEGVADPGLLHPLIRTLTAL